MSQMNEKLQKYEKEMSLFREAEEKETTEQKFWRDSTEHGLSWMIGKPGDIINFTGPRLTTDAVVDVRIFLFSNKGENLDYYVVLAGEPAKIEKKLQQSRYLRWDEKNHYKLSVTEMMTGYPKTEENTSAHIMGKLVGNIYENVPEEIKSRLDFSRIDKESYSNMKRAHEENLTIRKSKTDMSAALSKKQAIDKDKPRSKSPATISDPSYWVFVNHFSLTDTLAYIESTSDNGITETAAKDHFLKMKHKELLSLAKEMKDDQDEMWGTSILKLIDVRRSKADDGGLDVLFSVTRKNLSRAMNEYDTKTPQQAFDEIVELSLGSANKIDPNKFFIQIKPDEISNFSKS